MSQLKHHHFPFFIIAITALTACQPDIPEHIPSCAEFQLEKGFQIECLAAEPIVNTPVAMAFDEKNRIWLVEMPAYMPDLDGTGEDEPTGAITILEDQDGDGKLDTRKVFLDGLVLPRALALVHGGVLYAEPPNLWFVEKDGDDRPGKRTLVDSTYAIGGNVEHQPNGLFLNIDNWIYSAKSDARYRLRNGVWEKGPTLFRGQWGITGDDDGRLFYNDNSNQLQGDFLLPNVLERNPAAPPRFGAGQQICTDQRVWPVQATSVNRGYQKGMLDSLGKLVNTTSACGPVIYRGGQFPVGFDGNAFVCMPEVNLVKRNILTYLPDGKVTAKQAYEGREFLLSTDETFRPVHLSNGPDGGLYILDMRRGIIQHKSYMSAYLRAVLEQKGLDTVVGLGRVYRVFYEGGKRVEPPVFADLSNRELVQLFFDKNGYWRAKAQQVLIERNAGDAILELEKTLAQTANPLAAIHAFWTLEGLGILKNETIKMALMHKEGRVVSTALQFLAASQWADLEGFMPVLEQLKNRNNPKTDLLLGAVSGKFWNKEKDATARLLTDILTKYPADTLFSEAVLSGLAGQEESCRAYFDERKTLPLTHPIFLLLDKAIVEKKRLAERPVFKKTFTDNTTRGLQLFRTWCAICHRPNGEGIPNVAPPLVGAEMVLAGKLAIAETVRNGLSKPLIINGKEVKFNNAMPAFKDNPEWSEADIEAVAAFVWNAFAEGK